MNRRTLARLVLVVWILALAWLARRELFQGETSTMTAGTARLAPETQYFRVDAGALQIGVLNLAWDTLPTGFTVHQLLALDLPAGETIRRHLRVTEAVTTRALTLLSASQSYSSPSGAEEVDFEIRDDSLQTFLSRFGGSMSRTSGRFRPDARPTLPEILPVRLAYAGRLTDGATLEEATADLERRSTRRLMGRVAGDSTFILPDSVEFDTVRTVWRTVTLDTIRAWRVEVNHDGLSERWWVDESGRLVRMETPFGITLQRSPFDYSHMLYRDSLRASGPGPRQALAGVRSLAGSRIALDTGLATMRFSLSRVDGPLSPDAAGLLSGGRQSVAGTTVTVRRDWPADTITAPGGYLEEPGAARPPTGRMRMLADSAFRGAGSGRDSIITLTRWIASRIAVDTNATGIPEIVVIRPAQAGNPDAMARLLVSLARIGGFPARVANGLAVTAVGPLAHSWAEVWIGGGWVAVDPASGHAPASARLLRITEGGLGRPFETLLRTAALKVDPLAPEPR